MAYKLFKRNGETWVKIAVYETADEAFSNVESLVCKPVYKEIIPEKKQYWFTDVKTKDLVDYKGYITKGDV